MEFKGITKREEGRFITRYDVEYETVDGKQKIYEMISRSDDITDYDKLHGKVADAVVIIATDEADERIVLNKEFRMAVGDWVYNFPAGLIDRVRSRSRAHAGNCLRRQDWSFTELTI